APTNMAARYSAFARLRSGLWLREQMIDEIGGPPWRDPRAYDARSPLDWARRIAFSHVPLQLWWSRRDRIVVDQRSQSGALYREIERLNPPAPVREFVGFWQHTAEMRAVRRLPFALGLFGLLPRLVGAHALAAAHEASGAPRGS